MPDRSDALVFLTGALAGAGLAIGLVTVLRRPTETPGLTSHTVIRDDQGRIQTVETLQGLPLGQQIGGGAGGGQPAGAETVVTDDRR